MSSPIIVLEFPMRCVCLVLALLTSPLRAFAQTPLVTPETHSAVTKLIGEVLVNGRAYEYDRELADTIGPRLTGSDNYTHAAAWATNLFKSLGLKNVHSEPFLMPALWEPETPAIGNITGPRLQHLHIYSAGWSPSTPAAGINGQVVYLKEFLPPSKLESQKSTLTDQIVLIDAASFGEKPTIGEFVKALAVINTFPLKAVIISGDLNGTENASSLSFNGELAKFPVAQIGLEDELLIKRLLEKGAVTVSFSFKNRIQLNTQVMNVVAEIPGRELPNEYVVLGAHLDSWHPGTGAQDNGTGASTVFDTARSIQALGRPPRRSLRFILFGGEEEGLIGSSAYARMHFSEMPSIDAVLVSDSGAGVSKGWCLMGREDEKDALSNIEPLLAGLGSDGTNPDTGSLFETDHAAFDVLGVPTLVLWTSVEKYDKLHHRASDTFESVVRADLAQGVATTAATAYAIADSPQPFAPHRTPAQVQDMLQKAKELDNYRALRSVGFLP